MALALTVCGIVVALVVIGLFVFGLRRRLIQRSGGTFDCSLRWDAPRRATPAARAGPTAWPATTGTGSSGTASSRTRPARAGYWSARPSKWPAAGCPRGGGAGVALGRRGARLSPPRHPARTGDERGRADRIPRVAGGGPARTAGERRLSHRPDPAVPARDEPRPAARGDGPRPCEQGLLQTAVDGAHQFAVRGVTAELPEEGAAELLLLGPVHLGLDGGRGVVGPPVGAAVRVRGAGDGAGGRAAVPEDLVVLDARLVGAGRRAGRGAAGRGLGDAGQPRP